jgi:hypothetical protein
MTALIVLCLEELSIENAKTLITLSVKHDDSEAPAVRKITWDPYPLHAFFPCQQRSATLADSAKGGLERPESHQTGVFLLLAAEIPQMVIPIASFKGPENMRRPKPKEESPKRDK